ncbi:MAG: class I SAM-dependent methyltransferase [Maribacter sp.]|nr:class I SAM-dependent methyltransferase [Maribacter sp.]
MKYYSIGKRFLNDPVYLNTQKRNRLELSKNPPRTEIINFLLSLNQEDPHYLEIGVRDPGDNYNHINAGTKYSVDPGVEFDKNPVDFKMTSDEFFQKLSKNEILSNTIKFDVIFIDGLHLAEQVDKDIKNALNYIKQDGFIVLHDCNPPTEWQPRESYRFHHTPAHGFWNGTTWKAFLKWRSNPTINSCCVDSDWGVGILSKNHPIGKNIESKNPFFEYQLLEENRKEYLNLIDFESLKKTLQN